MQRPPKINGMYSNIFDAPFHEKTRQEWNRATSILSIVHKLIRRQYCNWKTQKFKALEEKLNPLINLKFQRLGINILKNFLTAMLE